MSGMTPGSVVVVHDEEWLVRSVQETERSGTRLDVTGVSELVRDQDATFFTDLEAPNSVQTLDLRDVRLVPDHTPGVRRSRLWLESLIRRSPRPSSDTRITVGHRGLLDNMNYQLRPAQQALQNLRPRILIGDAVGLGKTLEIGILLSELARRGRAERILVVTPRAVLEQFQHEMWTRFALPLVRLDSDGIQKVRQTLPASRNPFSYYRRVICSIDTLKNPARYRHHLDQQQWDVVVIDECHALINRATQKYELASLLAAQTEALILASATPHNGEPESFAELVKLLDPTAITDPRKYDAKDIEHLYVRRHRNSADVVATRVQGWHGEGLAWGEIAVVARSRWALDGVQQALEDAGVPVERLDAQTDEETLGDAVRLMTMHRAKGLEYRAMALARMSADQMPPSWVGTLSEDEQCLELGKERNLIYVAGSRARERLYVSWSGEPSTLLPFERQPAA